MLLGHRSSLYSFVCIPRNEKDEKRNSFCLRSVAQFLFINSLRFYSVDARARNNKWKPLRTSTFYHDVVFTMFNLLHIDSRQMMQKVNIDEDVSINSCFLLNIFLLCMLLAYGNIANLLFILTLL